MHRLIGCAVFPNHGIKTFYFRFLKLAVANTVDMNIYHLREHKLFGCSCCFLLSSKTNIKHDRAAFKVKKETLRSVICSLDIKILVSRMKRISDVCHRI